jgi:hypothetical protein
VVVEEEEVEGTVGSLLMQEIEYMEEVEDQCPQHKNLK